MSTRLQVVDTRPRVFREAVASPISRLAADFSSSFERARTQQKQAAQIEADRAFREKMQRLGFEHEDTQQERGFTHDSNEAVADRLFRQQSQDRLFGHEDTARHETFEHDSKENEANRGVTRRGQDITAQGIANDFNLGNRRLGLDAIQIGGQLQHYRNTDRVATAKGVGLSSTERARIFGAVNSGVTGGLDLTNPADVEAFQRAVSLVEDGRIYPIGRGALLPANVAGPPERGTAQSPSAMRMSAEHVPRATASVDSVAEQQAHWDEVARYLRERNPQADVEGEIGRRPVTRKR